MKKQKMIFALFLLVNFSPSLSMASEKVAKIDNTAAIKCPKEICDEQFAVPSDTVDIKNPKDPTSIFLANIKLKHPNVVALYAGANKSRRTEAIIDIPYIENAVVLYVSSYHNINWKLNYIADTENSKNKTNIVGVVYASSHKGTTVSGVSPEITIDNGRELGYYTANPSCHCSGGNFHCAGSNVIQSIGRLQKKYGIQVLDFAGKYSVSKLSFNNVNTPVNYAVEATKIHKEYEVLKNKCTARTNPNYESMYEENEVKGQHKTNDTTKIIFHDDSSSYVIENKKNKDNLEFDNHLYKFPLTTKTWGDYLNPENKMPSSGFMAYYLNAENPKKIIKTSHVFAIQKKYARDDFLGIPSEQFNAYWVGVLKVPKSEFYRVLMNKSWSGGRVSIDRRVLLEKGKHDIKEKVFIPKGNHIVEVEYSNGSNTIDVQVVIEPLTTVKKATNPTKFVANVKKEYPNVVALAAGAYEAKNKAIILDIPKSKVPIILYLGSNESINWQINNPNNTNIVGAVFGSYTEGSKVLGISQDKVINTGKQLGDYSAKWNCKSNRSSKHKTYGISVVESVGEYSTDYLKFQEVNEKCL